MEGSPKKIKSQAISDFKKHINLTQSVFLSTVGLDVIESARNGAIFRDIVSQDEYIDCFSSAGSFNVGRRNPEIIAALDKALDRYDMGNYNMVSDAKTELADALASLAPGNLNNVLLCSGGGEANDSALKLARGCTGRSGVLSMLKAYHGHTGFSLSAIGKPIYREPFEPLMPGFTHEPVLNDLASVERAVTPDTAAIIIEPVQGEAGIHVATPEFVRGLRKLCDEKGILLIFDEVQTGFGRTGKLFCCTHYDVQPDIMTLAKSLSGSVYPISAVIYNDKVKKFYDEHPDSINCTAGGSDLGCVVGKAVIDFMVQNDIPGNAEKMGKYIGEGLEKLMSKYSSLVKEVRRKGLMMGLEYTHDFYGPLMSYYLATNGVLAVFSGNNPKVMRIMPPLVINQQQADRLLAALDKAMAAALRSAGIIRFAYSVPVLGKLVNIQEMQVGIILIAKTLRKIVPFK